MISSKRKDYEKLNGKLVEKKFSKDLVREVCTFLSNGAYANDTKIFSRMSSVSFLIEKSCSTSFVFQKTGEKALNLTVLAGDKKVVGGGFFQCRNGKIYISNNSSRYCFPIEPIEILVHRLLKTGINSSDIYIKFKQKKFCAKEKTIDVASLRSKRYRFGYQKSHILNADQFLNIIKAGAVK